MVSQVGWLGARVGSQSSSIILGIPVLVGVFPNLLNQVRVVGAGARCAGRLACPRYLKDPRVTVVEVVEEFPVFRQRKQLGQRLLAKLVALAVEPYQATAMRCSGDKKVIEMIVIETDGALNQIV